MGDAQDGHAGTADQPALRKLTAIVSERDLPHLHQPAAQKYGVMFGNPETTTGGRALKFYSSVRLDIRRIASLKDGDAVVGSRPKVKVVKNGGRPRPSARPNSHPLPARASARQATYLDLGVDHRIIEKSGAWYAFNGERVGQGRDNARQFLKDNPDIRREVDTRLRQGLGLPVLEDAAVVAAARAGGARLRRPDAGEEEGVALSFRAHRSVALSFRARPVESGALRTHSPIGASP